MPDPCWTDHRLAQTVRIVRKILLSRPALIRSSANRSRRGYTLLEATFTFLLVGILSGLAATGGMLLLSSSRDGSAKHNLQLAASAAEAYYSQWAVFPTSDQMATAESAFTYVDGSVSTGRSTGSKVISVSAGSGTSPLFTLALLSDSGTCLLDTVAPMDSSTPDVHRTTTAANCYASTGTGTGTW